MKLELNRLIIPFVILFLMRVFQMLLCVGKFFGATEEDKKMWQEFKDGLLNGINLKYLYM